MNWIPLITAVAGIKLGGGYTFLTGFTLLGVHAVADHFGPSNVTRKPFLPELNLLLHTMAHLALVIWSLWYVANHELTTLEYVGFALSVGFCGGVGFVIAHELIHRRDRWQRGLGVLVLAANSYCHFRVEHVFGHHKNVGTPMDPASARPGEGLYFFWVRTIWYSYWDAWNIENKRCGGKVFHRKNRMLHYVFLQLCVLAAVYFVFGQTAILFFVAQSFVAVLLLETINYLEHYGLVRQKNAQGQYEPFSIKHSWDSDKVFTNAMLFNLGMHANHHMSPSKPHEELSVIVEAPRLPAGYSAMFLLALIPPLWKRVMNPIIQKA